MSKRIATCPECHKRFPVKADAPAGVNLLIHDADIFPKHTNMATGEWCSGSRWIVEQEDYVNEGP